ncbi:hypothetical protein ILUMI_26551 [Ignelater luminosus]|uniref:Uncharacterized protein n=1 Tax=Ignelater luminosus TaxID=2038154 RepID=A0A8K0C8A0_IGNLU|nr:hypothetical protein ILUMI_26551 [Ignelater luminosus]
MMLKLESRKIKENSERNDRSAFGRSEGDNRLCKGQIITGRVKAVKEQEVTNDAAFAGYKRHGRKNLNNRNVNKEQNFPFRYPNCGDIHICPEARRPVCEKLQQAGLEVIFRKDQVLIKKGAKTVLTSQLEGNFFIAKMKIAEKMTAYIAPAEASMIIAEWNIHRSKELWREAVRTFAYLKNRTETSVLPNKITPSEMRNGRKPNISKMKSS